MTLYAYILRISTLFYSTMLDISYNLCKTNNILSAFYKLYLKITKQSLKSTTLKVNK